MGLTYRAKAGDGFGCFIQEICDCGYCNWNPETAGLMNRYNFGVASEIKDPKNYDDYEAADFLFRREMWRNVKFMITVRGRELSIEATPLLRDLAMGQGQLVVDRYMRRPEKGIYEIWPMPKAWEEALKGRKLLSFEHFGAFPGAGQLQKYLTTSVETGTMVESASHQFALILDIKRAHVANSGETLTMSAR